MSYFKICVEESLGEMGIELTDEQITKLAKDVEIGAEMQGEYTGTHDLVNPLEEENKRLREELRMEREKRGCGKCGGKGYIVEPGPYHQSESECHICSGSGKV